jgi:hypothetical protein
MRNEILKDLIQKLSKERDDLTYEFKNIPFNDMSWSNASMNYQSSISNIDMRIDNLLMQITE